jgi:hypothetical protein
VTTEALRAADEYLAFLSSFRYAPEQPVEVNALGNSAAAQRMYGTIGGHESEVYLHLVAHLPRVPDPFAAGVLGVQLGGMVEQGANPHPLGDAMIGRLPADFAAARRFAERLEAEHRIEEPDEANPELRLAVATRDPLAASAWEALRLNTPAAMAAWCRHPPTRRAAARLIQLADDATFLGQHGGYAYFIGELLHAADGIELVVLVPEQRTGFVVELVAVRNAAHMFALLEDALVGDPAAGLLAGPKVDPEIAAIARGEVMMEGARTFTIGWHYEYWFGMHPTAGAHMTGLHPLIAAMIGVEASVAQLPTPLDRPVILMKPRQLGSRTCEAADFFSPLHNALRSAVEIRQTLSAEQVDALVKTLHAAGDQVVAS